MTARRQRSPVEGRVDRMMGEVSSSGSDLDLLTEAQKKSREKAAQRLVDELAFSDSSTAGDDESDTQGNRKTNDSSDGGENEGAAVYEKFKSRRATKRKQAAKASIATRKRVKANGDKVGQGRVWGDPVEEDDDALENEIPDYLKQRKIDFEENRVQLDHAGLRFPPEYDDVDFSDDERMESLEEKPAFTYIDPCAPYEDIHLPNSPGVVPAPIAQWLKKYQVQGTAFLHRLFTLQQGGILGDDMGLGKTIQVIAALTAAFGKTGDERDAKRMRKVKRAVGTRWYPRVLIVCPGGLMENWRYELGQWGYWVVETFHGSVEHKRNALEAAASGWVEIMITTYTTYRLNKSAINGIPWDCVIADECHIIKEPRSEITQAMNEVNALCRIGLTGTAIQNKYEEMWTLLNWTNPGRFGPMRAWKMTISEPLRLGQAHDATSAQLSKARKTAKKLVEVLLPKFFLRRMKTLIADQLPKKSDRAVFCPLTATQADAYENFIESDMVQYIKTSTDMCDCASGKKRGWCCYKYLPDSEETKWQVYVFPVIHVLRNLSNHLGLLIPSSNDPEKLNKELDYLKIACPRDWEELYRQRENIMVLANRDFCGKWIVLSKLLKFWYNAGDKVLVFSHSVRLLKLLQLLFKNTAYNISYLDGSLAYADRAKTVDEFNSDPQQFVFLISTRAGGMGLNITSANKVVVVDPNWNPSYDLQAQDRAYRIGQTRDVEVFRLISAGTIEEIVYARQIYKQQQANIGYNASLERRYFKGVQDDKVKKGEIFGLENLMSYQGENIVLRNIVNKTNIAESKAGVEVIGLDLDSQDTDDEDDPLKGNNDKEDAAMSQLAELISKGETSPDKWSARSRHTGKSDAIQGILAGAGVEYTHNNAEVVGSSRIEARLSKRAEEMGYNLDEQVFAQSQSQSQTVNKPAEPTSSDDEAGRGTKSKRHVAYRYRPPEEVRRRQFCTLAKVSGFEDVTEFALVVESWTQAQRRTCLDKFYDKLRRGEVAL